MATSAVSPVARMLPRKGPSQYYARIKDQETPSKWTGLTTQWLVGKPETTAGPKARAVFIAAPV